jgi:hypothetical protein
VFGRPQAIVPSRRYRAGRPAPGYSLRLKAIASADAPRNARDRRRASLRAQRPHGRFARPAGDSQPTGPFAARRSSTNSPTLARRSVSGDSANVGPLTRWTTSSSRNDR